MDCMTACSLALSRALVASSRKNGGPFIESPRNADSLALAARQADAALPASRVVGLRQDGEESVEAR